MGNKVTEFAVKIYKPEMLSCPKCDSLLKYKHTVSNKVVQFTSGKIFRIKNLGYGCLNCNDGNVYFSQTANKLSFKGYTYSSKIICMIDYYKKKNMGREGICDILVSKGIEISDRNVDIIHKKFLDVFNQDYDLKINQAYERMLNEFNEIRISLDFISISEKVYIILYDYFTSEKLALWVINRTDESAFIQLLSKYINPIKKISVISTVRPTSKYYLQVRKLVDGNTKLIAFNKF